MNYTSGGEIVTPEDHSIAAGIMLTICSVGVLANLLVMYMVRRAPSMYNSFGVLAFSQAIADFGHQSIFLFYVVPLLMTDSDFLKRPQVMRRVGHAVVICYQVCGFSHVCTSFNRFSAVYLPEWFKRFFSRRNATFLAIFTWTLAIIPTSVFLLHPYFACFMLFDIPNWVWNYTDSPLCTMIAFNIHFPMYISIASTFTILDVLTLWRVYRYTTVGIAINGVPESGASARKRKLDAIFFWQVCLQGVLYVTELVTYFFLSTMTTNKWLRFTLTDVIWCICHCGDGVLILSLNREIREIVKFIVRFRFETDAQQSFYYGQGHSHSPEDIRAHSVSSNQPPQIPSSLVGGDPSPAPSNVQPEPSNNQPGSVSTDRTGVPSTDPPTPNSANQPLIAVVPAPPPT